jgi:hypothetical protein
MHFPLTFNCSSRDLISHTVSDLVKSFVTSKAGTGQHRTVEYFLHSGHSIRITITYAEKCPRSIGNESTNQSMRIGMF